LRLETIPTGFAAAPGEIALPIFKEKRIASPMQEAVGKTKMP